MNSPAEKTFTPETFKIRCWCRPQVDRAPVAGEAACQNLGLFICRFDKAVDTSAMFRAFPNGKDIRVARVSPSSTMMPPLTAIPASWASCVFGLMPTAQTTNQQEGPARRKARVL